MRLRLCITACVLTAVSLVFAQNPPPPRGNASATIGGTQVTVDYGRPTLKGRELDALLSQLPPDRIWRAGANQVTTFTTGGKLDVGGKPVPAGKYSLYVHAPASGDWSLILNLDPGIELVKIYPQAPEALKNALWPRMDGYQKITDKEVIRVPMKSGTLSTPADLFTITLEPGQGGGVLTLAWGNRSWTVNLRPAA